MNRDLKTVASILRIGEKKLKIAGIDTARLDARVLAEHVLLTDRLGLFAHPERVLSKAEITAYDAVIERRVARVPVAHITGLREFWSLDFKVTADTLVPRPDSEVIVETVLQLSKSGHLFKRIADLGTGSGCLLLSVLHELGQATGVGLDASQGALNVAAFNAKNLGLFDRCDLIHDNWLDAGWAGRLLNAGGTDTQPYDLIISNPPYIPRNTIKDLAPEVVDHDPIGALDGGADGLSAYRSIAKNILSLLKPDGLFICEIGYGQNQSVPDILQSSGLQVVEIKQDLSEIPRCVVARADQ